MASGNAPLYTKDGLPRHLPAGMKRRGGLQATEFPVGSSVAMCAIDVDEVGGDTAPTVKSVTRCVVRATSEMSMNWRWLKRA